MTEWLPLLNHVANLWWMALVHATWQSSLAAMLLMGVVLIFKRLPATFRYGVLLVAMLKFAMPPLMALPSGIFSTAGPVVYETMEADEWGMPDFRMDAERPVPFAAPEASPEIGEDDRGMQFGQGSIPVAHVQEEGAGANKAELPAEAVLPDTEDDGGLEWSWTTMLMLLHAAGCAVMAVWLAIQWRNLKRVMREAHELHGGEVYEGFRRMAKEAGLIRVPRLYVNGKMASPFAYGLLRPVVVLPEYVLHLPFDRFSAVAAHELGHHVRRDLWVNWVQLLLSVVWWFNPVFWGLSRSLRQIREEACDDLLLARGLTTPDVYCDTLMGVAAQQAGMPRVGVALGFAERLHPLAARLTRIVNPSLKRGARIGRAGLLALLFLGVVMLPGLRTELVRTLTVEQTAPEELQLHMRLLGVAPDGVNQLHDGQGHPVDMPYMSIAPAAGWKEDEQYFEFLFSTGALPANIIFERFVQISDSETGRSLGGYHHEYEFLVKVAGENRLRLGGCIARTIAETREAGSRALPVSRVDLSFRYYAGPKDKCLCSFSGPFHSPKTMQDKTGQSYTLSRIEDREDGRLPRAIFKFFTNVRVDSEPPIIAYRSDGRRYLGEFSGWSSSSEGFSATVEVEGVPSEEISAITVGETCYEEVFRNILLRPEGQQPRSYPPYVDAVAGRWGCPVEEVRKQSLSDPDLQADLAFDVMEGDLLSAALFQYARGGRIVNPDESTRMRIRAGLQRYMSAPFYPQATANAIATGIAEQWPEYIALGFGAFEDPERCLGILDPEEGTPWGAYRDLGRDLDSMLVMVARPLASCGDMLTPEQWRQAAHILRERRTREIFYAFVLLFRSSHSKEATAQLLELARDEFGPVWALAVSFLCVGSEDFKRNPPADLSDRVAVIQAVEGQGELTEEQRALLTGLVSLDYALLTSLHPGFISTVEAFFRHCAPEVVKKRTADLLDALGNSEEYARNPELFCRTMYSIVLEINNTYNINIGGIGTNAKRDYSWISAQDWETMRKDIITWNNSGEVPGNQPPEEKVVLHFPEDRSIGSLGDFENNRVEAQGVVEWPKWNPIRFYGYKGVHDYSALAQLKAFDRLYKVELDGCAIDDEALVFLAELQNMEELNLSGSTVTDAGLPSLIPLKKLTDLDLEGCSITDEGMRSLGQMPQLNRLNLSGSKVTDAGLPLLIPLKELMELHLEGCLITDEGMKSLGKMPQLYALSLDSAWISDEGLGNLASLPGLTRLRLESCPITVEGIRKLRALSKLQSFSFGGPGATDECLRELSSFPALDSLDLREAAITAEGLKCLPLLRMESLKFRQMPWGDEIIPVLSGFSALRYLSLEDTDFTEAGAEVLRKSLPGCYVSVYHTRAYGMQAVSK